jgi:uncharacterized membrane protein YcaP (DUF421 family)
MEWISSLLGLHTEQLNTLQMIARAIIIFFVSLLLIRIAGIRTLGKKTVFDYLTILILGSILGRGIVAANQPFFGSLATVAVIMLLHRGIAWITYKSKKAGRIFKGDALPLVKNGRRNNENLKKANISQEDIAESLRLVLQVDSIDEIKEAYLERSGDISFVKDGEGKSKS